MIATDYMAPSEVAGAAIDRLQPMRGFDLQQTPRYAVYSAGRERQPAPENYRVVIEAEGEGPTPLRSVPLRVSVDAYSEQGVTEYQATLLSDRTIVGYGDSSSEAIDDLADVLVSDLLFLRSHRRRDMTADAVERLALLESLFRIH